MALKIDFLVKEIYVKITTKLLGVFRTIFLLFFFSISSQLDNFYFAKSIVGIVILVNILFEITYANQINLFKNNDAFIKQLHLLLNKFTLFLSMLLIGFSIFFLDNLEIKLHIIILSFWGFLNINSNFFLIVNRYQNQNRKVLLYYLFIALLDIALLITMLYAFSKNTFLAISFSLFIAEFLVFFTFFLKQLFRSYQNAKKTSFSLNIEKSLLFKVLFILIVISFIDISDKYFLSFFGEGQITYYTYGLYAPLVIRQSLDIRTNFFVQINKSENLKETKQVFFRTLKKLIPFFLLGVIFLLVTVEISEELIKTHFKIQDFKLLKRIIYLGILITPMYMIWDLFYRFYYRAKKINKLFKVVFLGLISNIILNYLLGIKFNLGIYGILLSTLIVFLFYNFVSFNYFFKKSTSE